MIIDMLITEYDDRHIRFANTYNVSMFVMLLNNYELVRSHKFGLTP